MGHPGWQTAALDRFGPVGFYNALAVHDGEVHVAYLGDWPAYAGEGASSCSTPISGAGRARVKYATTAPLADALRIAPPAAPIEVAAIAEPGSIALTWGCLVDPFVTYNLYWQDGAACNLVSDLPADLPRYQLTGLLDGTSYTFRLTAENTSGEGPATEIVAMTPPPPPPPPDGGVGGSCFTFDDLCSCGGCFGGTVVVGCGCPAGTTQYGGEIGCQPGQSSGCLQCVCP